MSDLESSSPQAKASRLVKCDRHGLHYDPEKMSGCVICRREAGGSAPQGGAAYGGASAATASAPSGLALHLGIAAVLCLAGGFALFSVHSAIAAVLNGTAGGGAGFDEPREFDPNALPEGQMGEALRELGAGEAPAEGTEPSVDAETDPATTDESFDEPSDGSE